MTFYRYGADTATDFREVALVKSGTTWNFLGIGVGVCLANRCLDGASRTRSTAYRSIPVHEDSGLAESRYQSEDLGLIPWGGGRSDRLRLDLRWHQSRSWLCFAAGDDFLVDGGTLVNSFRC